MVDPNDAFRKEYWNTDGSLKRCKGNIQERVTWDEIPRESYLTFSLFERARDLTSLEFAWRRIFPRGNIDTDRKNSWESWDKVEDKCCNRVFVFMSSAKIPLHRIEYRANLVRYTKSNCDYSPEREKLQREVLAKIIDDKTRAPEPLGVDRWQIQEKK